MKEGYRGEGVDLKRLTLYFQKRIWIVILLAVIGAGLGALIYQMVKSVSMPVEYQAVSKLYISFAYDETGEIYEEPIRSFRDLQDTVLYVFDTMKARDFTGEFSRCDASFVLGEFKAMHPNSFFIRQFEITDEPFDKLVRRWQRES